MSQETFSVDGLHCRGCVGTVEHALSTIPDVHSVQVELDVNGVSRVTVDTDRHLVDTEVQQALDKEGNFHLV
ncbi:heavy-metal-associated domain-containing protein [Nocardia stercoris]|nr:heavy metal-associated domain-containing protein [Nocardia stercoris]